jgi:serine/threonine protein phosphatase 1
MRFPIAEAANFRQPIAQGEATHFASPTARDVSSWREAMMFRRPRERVSGWLKTVRRRDSRYPPAPEGLILYAIGDIHGRSDCLERAHDLIDRDVVARASRGRTQEIYIGDYVDRGPDSKGVINRLIARSSATSIVALRGNHEIIMESFLREQTPFEDWRRLGGLETILSYGVDARSLLGRGGVRPRDLAENLPASHLRFIASLKSVYTIGRYCFVHAGIRPGVAIERQSMEDLAWIRDDFLNFPGHFGFIVVHGHTPVTSVDFLSNRINVDTGAYVTNRLSILRIDAEGVTALETASR